MVDDSIYAYIRLWQGKHVDDCLGEIIGLCKALRIGTIYNEKNSDKGYLNKAIRLKGHPSIGYSEDTNKFIKISTHLRSVWANVQFLDCEAYPLDANALNQILDYNENAAHDDMPDSLASVIRQYKKKPQIKAFREGV